ncbi:hypothetical protein BJ875DRAFT_102446 [Amylocarpus encephaloides]|uniref:GPI anchored cell wall protein n=1 Tax=Amylocarpus encephaloides TaxID=45428 RepID=A0A9P7YQC8_9HELO|nr:hypothetical protein BJ875DRAFT_102446 [Amylocarpus encephaloides]
MYTTLFSLVAVATFASAQSTTPAAQSTARLWIPGPSALTQNIVASVINSNSAATTYAVQCKAGTEPNKCGLPSGLILTEGPKHIEYTTLANSTTGSMTCDLRGTTTAICSSGFRASLSNVVGGTIVHLTGTGLAFTDVPLTDKATATAPPADSSAPLRTLGGDDLFSRFGATSTSATPSSSTATSSSTTAAVTSTSTAGMAMITANAQWVVGGVAAGLALL